MDRPRFTIERITPWEDEIYFVINDAWFDRPIDKRICECRTQALAQFIRFALEQEYGDKDS